jgi:hypothetical protein
MFASSAVSEASTRMVANRASIVRLLGAVVTMHVSEIPKLRDFDVDQMH